MLHNVSHQHMTFLIFLGISVFIIGNKAIFKVTQLAKDSPRYSLARLLIGFLLSCSSPRTSACVEKQLRMLKWMFTSQLNAPFDQKHELLPKVVLFPLTRFWRRLIASYARRQLQEYRGKFSSVQFLRKKKVLLILTQQWKLLTQVAFTHL